MPHPASAQSETSITTDAVHAAELADADLAQISASLSKLEPAVRQRAALLTGRSTARLYNIGYTDNATFFRDLGASNRGELVE